MITHEPDIASFAKRNILFRDGKIIDDHENLVPAAHRGRERK
jgi:ABC-type lipoprotein export system ATPase subunit